MIRALRRVGFRLKRITGSHYMMEKEGHPTIIPVPVHGKHPIPDGTLASILRQAGLTKKQLFKLLGR